jgi:hypothetical protein
MVTVLHGVVTQPTCIVYTHGLQCEKWTELPSLCLQMNQQCKVCGEPAAGFHFGAFTCEGCKVRLRCAQSWSVPSRMKAAHWNVFVKEGFNALQDQWLLNVPQGLTFNNPTFCSHSGLVWIWEQTAIVYVYRINWLVFIIETECVYCAVRTGPLNMIMLNRSCWR